MSDPPDPPDRAEPDPPEAPLLEIDAALPPVVETPAALEELVARFEGGRGPFAIDAERASGYRYSHRAYLIQIRRRGAGTALIDPVPFGDVPNVVFEPLAKAIGDIEWVIHAASQDLACLAEVGLRPTLLFDTELAGRLLNYPRVGLAALVEELLGFRMRKEHSAVDWSKRPLPEPWLLYAALDVERLVELRDILAQQLEEAGKRQWAEQEFAAWVAADPAPPRREPWRRTSGIHRVRGRRGLALVRAMWELRDDLARRRDITTNRIVSDSAIDGPPPPRLWAEKNPVAAARLRRCRDLVTAIADEADLPQENLISPDAVRRLAWSPPDVLSVATVAAALAGYAARPWQIALVAEPLAAALAD
jgi:ribonuclease D